MRKEKTLIGLLHGLVDLLAEESAHNSEFASKLDVLLSELPEKKRASKRPNATPPPEYLPNIHAEWGARGEMDFRLWLRDQPIAVLRAVIRTEDLDATRRTPKWKEPEKLAEFIADSIRARQLRGSAFIGRNTREGEVSMEDEKKAVFVFQCPNCSGTASPTYTKSQLETALEEGELSVYHIVCDHSWKRRLEPHEKAKLKSDLDSGLLFS